MAICFILMIVSSGSDGKYFPYTNFIGAIFFGISLLVLAAIKCSKENKKGKHVS
jgi:hypothetical protein